jgi:hypothetical protein
LRKAIAFWVEAAGGEQKLAARKRACGERIEANNGRRIAARYGISVSLPKAYCNGWYMEAGEYAS